MEANTFLLDNELEVIEHLNTWRSADGDSCGRANDWVRPHRVSRRPGNEVTINFSFQLSSCSYLSRGPVDTFLNSDHRKTKDCRDQLEHCVERGNQGRETFGRKFESLIRLNEATCSVASRPNEEVTVKHILSFFAHIMLIIPITRARRWWYRRRCLVPGVQVFWSVF